MRPSMRGGYRFPRTHGDRPLHIEQGGSDTWIRRFPRTHGDRPLVASGVLASYE